MIIKNFEYLIKVAETGSITKAAHDLYVSQPYLSKLIREVEEHYGFSIFLRTSKGVELTSEGESFIKQSKTLLTEFNRLSNIASNRIENRESFSISTIKSSLVVECFVRLIKEYENKYIEFKLIERNGKGPLEDVYLLNADLGIVYTQLSKLEYLKKEVKRKGMRYKRICTLTYCILLRSGHPIFERKQDINIWNLKKYGLVRYDNNKLPYASSKLEVNTYSDLVNLNDIKNIMQINSRALLHNILTQTDYFSIGTTAARNQEELFGIVSIPFPESSPGERIEMGVISSKKGSINPIASRFIEMITETYGDF